jgi:HK97 family phage major capsid protein
MTGMIRSNQGAAWLPEDFGAQLDLVVQAKAVAARVCQLFSTAREKVAFPTWVSDPAVGWYNELDEITEADGDSDEVVVTPSKTAGLTLLSNELVNDSDPAIASQVAHALARQISEAIDTAFFANTTSKGPNGLLSLSYTAVDTGTITAVASLDLFIDARFAAEAHGAKISHWLMTPAIAKQLAKIKTATSYQTTILDLARPSAGPETSGDGLVIAGIPVITSTHVDSSTLAWGIDGTQQRYVSRQGTTVQPFDSITNDGKYLRAISRVGLGFLNPAGVVRLYDAA